MPQVTLLALIETALDPEGHIWEDFTAPRLAALREQLARGIALIDRAKEKLK